MSRRIMFDIQPQKKAITPVAKSGGFKLHPMSLSDSGASYQESASERQQTDEQTYTPPTYTPPQKITYRSKTHPPKGLWYGVCVIIAVAIYVISMHFAKAYISVVPKTAIISINEPMVAYKNKTEGLVFDTIVVKDTFSMPLENTTKSYQETPAVGEVILYNNFGETPQKLVQDTRLIHAVSGRIYKIKESVSIPGRVKKGSLFEPGSIKVAIYAEAPGEEYNTIDANNDFRVVAFEKTPKKNAIYARSTIPLHGGAKGEHFIAPDEVIEGARNTLLADLKNKLLTRAHFDSPQDVVLYDALGTFAIDDRVHIEQKEDGTVMASLTGEYTGFLMREDAIKKALVDAYLDDVSPDAVTIPTLRMLAVERSDTANTTDPSMVSFSTEAPIEVIWDVDVVELKESLRNTKTQQFAATIKDFSSIASAEVTVKPFWKHTLPATVDAIRVEVAIADKRNP